jgi:Domain of unknown function (DUF4112)
MARTKVFIPEIVEPDEALPADLLALRKFAYLMDEAVRVPGTRFAFGLDAAIGLVPGIGDAAGAILSTWIVVGALRHRVPMARVVQMVFNIILDMALGAIPILGDTFDFLFEENVINLKLLLRHRDRLRPARRMHEIALAVAIVLLVIIAACFVVLTALVVAVFWLIQNR